MSEVKKNVTIHHHISNKMNLTQSSQRFESFTEKDGIRRKINGDFPPEADPPLAENSV